MNLRLLSSEAQATRRWMGRLSPGGLLVALVVMLIAAPFQDSFSGGEIIEPLVLTLVLISAALTTGARGWALTLVVTLVALALGGRWLDHFRPGLVSPAAGLLAATLFVVLVVAQFLVFIFRAPRVNTDVLCAGLAIYLLLGLLWSFIYILVAQLLPDAFALNGTPISHPPLHGFNAVYFTYITLTTVGYGDIAPVTSIARMLAALEALTGTLFMAVLVARLVALYTTQTTGSDKSGPDGKGTSN